MTSNWLFLIRLLLLLLLLLASVVVGYGYWSSTRALDPGSDIYLVERGSGISQLARKLMERKVIGEPYSLNALAYAKGYIRDIKAGEYRFDRGITLSRLLKQTVDGKVVQYPITIIEGWTFKQVNSALQTAPKLQHTLIGKNDGQLIELLKPPPPYLEGMFFPDTYFYSAGTKDFDVLRQAYRRMSDHLMGEWTKRPKETILQSPEEVLILASVIEKETGRPDERALISAVFHNRLKRGMRLQTDPTVIYGLGENFDGNLTRKHLNLDTPYNTYIHKGLPPTPISMPGSQSLHAALNPADTKALYFVARGDGSHEFSSTLKSHIQAVVQYQLERKTKSSSSSAVKNN